MKFFLAVLTFFFYTITLFGAFDVKIAVYKNGQNLRANIAKIQNTKYRKNISVEKRHHLYYAHAIVASNTEAKSALSAYRKVFKDAFIAKEQVELKQKKPVKVVSVPTLPKVKVQAPKPTIDVQALLANKTVYLCYENGPEYQKGRLVKMVFEEGHVTYNPLKKMSTPVEMPYEFQNNDVTLHLSAMKITHHVTKQTPDFLSATTMVNGIKGDNLRYYFDKQRALAFLHRL